MEGLTCPHVSMWEHPWEVSALRLDSQPIHREAGDMSDGHGEVPVPDYCCGEDRTVDG